MARNEESTGRRFWVEKTLVAARPDRQSGEHALGRALWSPQRAEGGRDIYRLMREVKRGDVVFHFIDNQQLDSYSVAAAEVDESFVGVTGTDWAGRPAYRVELHDHTKIRPPIDRHAFLDETSEYRPLIRELLESETGLFFNREFNLNQGSYLTAAPLKLVQIWNDIHRNQTGEDLNRDWNIPPIEPRAATAKRFWIFQGNPAYFDVDTYVRERTKITWSLRQYPELVHTGDEVLIWRSGPTGGVVARCVALSDADASTAEDASELWKQPSESDPLEQRCWLSVEENFPDNPISRQAIKSAIPDLPIFKFAQNTNYPISEDQFRRILKLREVKERMRIPEFGEFTGIEKAIGDLGIRTAPGFLRRLIASLASKPFVILTGTSGTGKTKVALALARWLSSDSRGYEVVPVGADWTGNDNIIGYPDGLDAGAYIAKPALELISRAADDMNAPHFLILDEMNLSHVERYFADLLSAMESGEPIPLYSGSRRKFSGKDVAPRLPIPRNVFVIGTVNVDETTYMFSPKVLDRANVLEFRVNADDLDSYLGKQQTVNLSSITGQGRGLGAALVNAVTNQVDIPADVRDRFRSELLLFFNVLKPHGAEFGYRVASEASRFLHFYREIAGDSEQWFERGFDAVIVQKLLPKLHGQRTRLAPLLRKLWFLCVTPSATRGANVLDQLDEVSRSTERSIEPVSEVPIAAPYPISAEKIARMWRLLSENGFTSFAEA